jgi:hypothetical protein
MEDKGLTYYHWVLERIKGFLWVWVGRFEGKFGDYIDNGK